MMKSHESGGRGPFTVVCQPLFEIAVTMQKSHGSRVAFAGAQSCEREQYLPQNGIRGAGMHLPASHGRSYPHCANAAAYPSHAVREQTPVFIRACKGLQPQPQEKKKQKCVHARSCRVE